MPFTPGTACIGLTAFVHALQQKRVLLTMVARIHSFIHALHQPCAADIACIHSPSSQQAPPHIACMRMRFLNQESLFACLRAVTKFRRGNLLASAHLTAAL